MLWSLVKKELLALSRDVHGLGALFFMPVVFIVVMSMALKDVYSPETKNVTYAIVQQDEGKTARKLAELWEKGHPGAIATPDNWQEEVRSGRLKYVIQIEPGFTKSADTLDGAAGIKVRLLADPGLDNGLFEASKAKLTALVGRLRVESVLAQLPAEGRPDSKALASDQMVETQRLSASTRPTAVQQNVPAWLVFGMFFVVTSISGLFVDERSSGALARLSSLGVSPLRLIVAKIVPYMLVNGIQATLMLAVGVWFMPLIGGDALSLSGIHWGAMLSMLAAISAASVGMALAIACLVKTHAQASAFGPILNVLMAALGGVMVPIFVMPVAMQQIARFSPMNWGLEGLLDVLLRGGGLASIVPELAKLWVFAFLMLGLGYILFRRGVKAA